MIAHTAAKHYLEQPDTYAVSALREQFGGETLIVEGKPYLVFPDESTLSVQKIVRAKFVPDTDQRRQMDDKCV